MVTLNTLQEMPKTYVYDLKDKIMLSDDESVVYDMVVRNKTTQQIADRIMTSTRTVYRYKKTINRKLQNLSFYTNCTIDK